MAVTLDKEHYIIIEREVLEVVGDMDLDDILRNTIWINLDNQPSTNWYNFSEAKIVKSSADQARKAWYLGIGEEGEYSRNIFITLLCYIIGTLRLECEYEDFKNYLFGGAIKKRRPEILGSALS